MQIRVLGWRCENLRGGLTDLDIDLTINNNRLTLIQMPNGTGKTSTMRLLRAALGGERLPPEEIVAFRSTDVKTNGLFELRLSVDDKYFAIECRFNFELGTVAYYTSRAQLNSGGKVAGNQLPEALKRLFTKEFIRLFVFDGELAAQIRDLSRETATDAIVTLYHLNHIRDLKIAARRLLEEEQNKAKASKAMEQRGITRLTNEEKSLRQNLGKLKASRQVLNNDRKAAELKLSNITTDLDAFIKQDESVAAELAQIDSSIAENRQKISLSAKGALSKLRVPSSLGPQVLVRLLKLGEGLERLKLPKTTSAEFFRELAIAAECVCGRPIGSAESAAIESRADRYLAENQIAVINAMKAAVRSVSLEVDDLGAVLEDLNQLVVDRQLLVQKRDRLLSDIEASGSDQFRALSDKRDGVREELSSLNVRIMDLESTESSHIKSRNLSELSNIYLCELKVQEVNEKLATATATRRFLLQTNYVCRLLDEIQENALSKLRQRVISATNSKLPMILSSEQLKVKDIDGAISLQSSAIHSKTGVSEGQSLAVAYAFLTSLFEDAPVQLPFIVDSPAVSLDNEVRRQVAALIPKLFDQLIMFVISSERSGFADSFYKRDDVNYITIARDGENVVQLLGRDSFQTFQGPDEEL